MRERLHITPRNLVRAGAILADTALLGYSGLNILTPFLGEHNPVNLLFAGLFGLMGGYGAWSLFDKKTKDLSDKWLESSSKATTVVNEFVGGATMATTTGVILYFRMH